MGEIKGTNDKSNIEILRDGVVKLNQELAQLNKNSADYAKQEEELQLKILEQETLITQELQQNTKHKVTSAEADIKNKAEKMKAELHQLRESIKSLNRDATNYANSATAIKQQMYNLIPVVSALSAVHQAEMQQYQQEIEAEWALADQMASVIQDKKSLEKQESENDKLKKIEDEGLHNLDEIQKKSERKQIEDNEKRERELIEANEKREKKLKEENEKRLKEIAEHHDKDQKKREEIEEQRKLKLLKDEENLALKLKLLEEQKRIDKEEIAKNQEFQRLSAECIKNVKIIFASQDILAERLDENVNDKTGNIESLRLRNDAINLFNHNINLIRKLGVDFPYEGDDLLDQSQVNISNIVNVLNTTEQLAHEPQKNVVLKNNAVRTNTFMLEIAACIFGLEAIKAEAKRKLEEALQEAIANDQADEVARLKKELGIDGNLSNNNANNNNHPSGSDPKYKYNRALGRLFLKLALISLGISMIGVSIAIAVGAPVATPFAIGGCKYGLSLLLAGLGIVGAAFMHYQDKKATKRPNTLSYKNAKVHSITQPAGFNLGTVNMVQQQNKVKSNSTATKNSVK